MMPDFISDIVGLLWTWIFFAFLILLVVYLSMARIARHFGCGNLFDKYINMVVDWIRDAHHD